MSTIHPYTAICGLCGKESEHRRVGSYSIFRGPDLDGRPGSMLRETIPHWVRDCPFCGYTRGNLEMTCPLTRDELARAYSEVDAAYPWPAPEPEAPRMRLAVPACLRKEAGSARSGGPEDELFWFLGEDKPTPPIPRGKTYLGAHLAKRFAKFGAMLAKTGDAAGSARQFLRAAWVFDDKNEDAGAAFWRRAAIEQAEGALADCRTESRGNLFCTLADMLRRVGEFSRVTDLIQPVALSGDELRLFRLQQRLAAAGDAAAYSVDDPTLLSRGFAP